MKKALHQLVPIIIFCIGLNSFAQAEKGKFLVGARTTLNAGVIEHSRVNEKMKRGTDIAPLTKALRDFDKQKHPLENYKYLAWDGLYDFGKAIGLINRDEFDRLGRLLSKTVYSDSYESNCN